VVCEEDRRRVGEGGEGLDFEEVRVVKVDLGEVLVGPLGSSETDLPCPFLVFMSSSPRGKSGNAFSSGDAGVLTTTTTTGSFSFSFSSNSPYPFFPFALPKLLREPSGEGGSNHPPGETFRLNEALNKLSCEPAGLALGDNLGETRLINGGKGDVGEGRGEGVLLLEGVGEGVDRLGDGRGNNMDSSSSSWIGEDR